MHLFLSIENWGILAEMQNHRTKDKYKKIKMYNIRDSRNIIGREIQL